MALLACWVAFPLILLALAHGAGTLIARAAARDLPAGVRIPCGLALIIAVMDLATRTATTARLAVPAAVALGAAGLALAASERRRSPADGAAPHRFTPPRPTPDALAAAVVFAAYAAPVVLSGEATWAGYIKLDDTSTWLALVDRALEHGRTLTGLPISTYREVLAHYLVVGYPLGAFLPVGLGHALLGQDSAWLTDPWMATMAAALTLALARIARGALPDAPRWQPAAIAALAGQAALLYGYYLWGGMKELAGAFLVAAFAVTAPLPLEGERRLRATAAHAGGAVGARGGAQPRRARVGRARCGARAARDPRRPAAPAAPAAGDRRGGDRGAGRGHVSRPAPRRVRRAVPRGARGQPRARQPARAAERPAARRDLAVAGLPRRALRADRSPTC